MSINDMLAALQGFKELDISGDTIMFCKNDAGDFVPVLTVAYDNDKLEVIG